MTACAPHLVVARSAGALDQLSQLVDGLFSLEAHVRAKARQESVQAHTDGGEGGEGKWVTGSLRSRKSSCKYSGARRLRQALSLDARLHACAS